MSKLTNEYQEVLSSEFYAKCPKAVIAAIAVSLGLLKEDGDFEKVEDALLEEWEALHVSGIVPQKPFKKVGYKVEILDNDYNGLKIIRDENIKDFARKVGVNDLKVEQVEEMYRDNYDFKMESQKC